MIETALLCLALNVYFEARSEPIAGQLAVAEVTLNRVASQDYPNSICEVVLQENQNGCSFSWWCDGKSDKPTERHAFQQSKALAKMMIEDRLRPEQRVVAMIPGHHANWSKGWWTPAKRNQPPNCS